eukprot:CAMPEP_0183369978 /NCGR_PEP_ID=MMETSP0164_2-20130417/101139_1 /TAXON_ID=221442 /ORGANISM="Coccolithus pelagicus ssp braarudi, Strain PLY182g" /LENGTH=48 /DNA_ID= /DNA_START= /DNA_END= /DNA_ORIENTATION=
MSNEGRRRAQAATAALGHAGPPQNARRLDARSQGQTLPPPPSHVPRVP